MAFETVANQVNRRQYKHQLEQLIGRSLLPASSEGGWWPPPADFPIKSPSTGSLTMLLGTIRTLFGVAAGLAVGLILQESLLAGFDVLLGIDRSLTTELRGANPPDTVGSLIIIMVWGLAATASAAMARALSGHLGGTLLSGTLWLLIIGLTAGLAPVESWAFHAAWMVGLAGTVAGGWLASRSEYHAEVSGA